MIQQLTLIAALLLLHSVLALSVPKTSIPVEVAAHGQKFKLFIGAGEDGEDRTPLINGGSWTHVYHKRNKKLDPDDKVWTFYGWCEGRKTKKGAGCTFKIKVNGQLLVQTTEKDNKFEIFESEQGQEPEKDNSGKNYWHPEYRAKNTQDEVKNDCAGRYLDEAFEKGEEQGLKEAWESTFGEVGEGATPVFMDECWANVHKDDKIRTNFRFVLKARDIPGSNAPGRVTVTSIGDRQKIFLVSGDEVVDLIKSSKTDKILEASAQLLGPGPFRICGYNKNKKDSPTPIAVKIAVNGFTVARTTRDNNVFHFYKTERNKKPQKMNGIKWFETGYQGHPDEVWNKNGPASPTCFASESLYDKLGQPLVDKMKAMIGDGSFTNFSPIRAGSCDEDPDDQRLSFCYELTEDDLEVQETAKPLSATFESLRFLGLGQSSSLRQQTIGGDDQDEAGGLRVEHNSLTLNDEDGKDLFFDFEMEGDPDCQEGDCECEGDDCVEKVVLSSDNYLFCNGEKEMTLRIPAKDKRSTKMTRIALTPLAHHSAGGNTVREKVSVKARNKVSEVIVDRNISQTRECSLWGDPHLKTWDGPSNQNIFDGSIGYQHVVKHDDLQVQADHFKCAGSRSCLGQILMHYRGDAFTVGTLPNRAAELKVRCNGQIIEESLEIATGTNKMIKCGFLELQVSGWEIEVKFQDGPLLVTSTIFFSSWSAERGRTPDQRISAWMKPLEIPPFMKKKVTGLCGNYNGQDNDDREPSDLPDKENLFYSCGFVEPEDGVAVDYDLCNKIYRPEPCIDNSPFIGGMIYKRDAIIQSSHLLDDFGSKLQKNLKRREVVDSTDEPLTYEQAWVLCNATISENELVSAASTAIITNSLQEMFEWDAGVLSALIESCAQDCVMGQCTAQEDLTDQAILAESVIKQAAREAAGFLNIESDDPSAQDLIAQMNEFSREINLEMATREEAAEARGVDFESHL